MRRVVFSGTTLIGHWVHRTRRGTALHPCYHACKRGGKFVS